LRSLGIDPGKVNFAMVAIDAKGVPYFARMLRSTIRSMSMHEAHQRVKYRSMIRRVLVHARPDEVMVETFVARGFGTQLTEVINVMIGSLMSECDHLHIAEHATMASSWKNSVRKENDLDALYAHGASVGLPPHLVDALMLATYLRHNKTMDGVDWDRVKTNIELVAKMVPPQDLVKIKIKKAKKGKSKDEVSTPARNGRGKNVRSRKVLAVERGKRGRVHSPRGGNRSPGRRGPGKNSG
jgi:hypothetical protein